MPPNTAAEEFDLATEPSIMVDDLGDLGPEYEIPQMPTDQDLRTGNDFVKAFRQIYQPTETDGTGTRSGSGHQPPPRQGKPESAPGVKDMKYVVQP